MTLTQLLTYSLLYLKIDQHDQTILKFIKKKPVNTNLGKYFFTNRVVNLWNKLPHEIANAKNLNSFKNQIDLLFKNKMYRLILTCTKLFHILTVQYDILSFTT